MTWDTRAWSFFIFVIALCMYVAAVGTPYKLKAEYVKYGPDDGLWTTEGDVTPGYQWATRILLIIGLVCLIIALICYIWHFKREHHIVHLVSLVMQLIAGIAGVIGGAVYCANSRNLKGDGMWMSVCSSLIFIINSVVLACLPYTQFEIRHKSYRTDDEALEEAKLRSANVKEHGLGEEKVPLTEKGVEENGNGEPDVVVVATDPSSPDARYTKM